MLSPNSNLNTPPISENTTDDNSVPPHQIRDEINLTLEAYRALMDKCLGHYHVTNIHEIETKLCRHHQEAINGLIYLLDPDSEFGVDSECPDHSVNEYLEKLQEFEIGTVHHSHQDVCDNRICLQSPSDFNIVTIKWHSDEYDIDSVMDTIDHKRIVDICKVFSRAKVSDLFLEMIGPYLIAIIALKAILREKTLLG